MAFACFVMAVKAYPVDGGSMLGFVWWVSAAAGLTFSAGRAKRKAARDQHIERMAGWNKE